MFLILLLRLFGSIWVSYVCYPSLSRQLFGSLFYSHALHEITNLNGRGFISFCNKRNLLLISEVFNSKKSHRLPIKRTIILINFTVTRMATTYLRRTNKQMPNQWFRSIVPLLYRFLGRKSIFSMASLGTSFPVRFYKRKWLAIRCRSIDIVLEEDMYDNGNGKRTHHVLSGDRRSVQ